MSNPRRARDTTHTQKSVIETADSLKCVTADLFRQHFGPWLTSVGAAEEQDPALTDLTFLDPYVELSPECTSFFISTPPDMIIIRTHDVTEENIVVPFEDVWTHLKGCQWSVCPTPMSVPRIPRRLLADSTPSSSGTIRIPTLQARQVGQAEGSTLSRTKTGSRRVQRGIQKDRSLSQKNGSSLSSIAKQEDPEALTEDDTLQAISRVARFLPDLSERLVSQEPLHSTQTGSNASGNVVRARTLASAKGNSENKTGDVHVDVESRFVPVDRVDDVPGAEDQRLSKPDAPQTVLRSDSRTV